MSVVHQQIGEWLGVPIPKTDHKVLEIVEGRLPTSAINRLVALGITRPEIDSLVISLRTLQHRRSHRQKLTVEESDRLVRVARLLSLATSVYESRERALAWLRRPHPRLRERAPLEMLKTDTGSRLVEELLVQIDEGMFV
jgi:putative toxin-antitoxin system antitoxin component (TIGR02293 family)